MKQIFLILLVIAMAAMSYAADFPDGADYSSPGGVFKASFEVSKISKDTLTVKIPLSQSADRSWTVFCRWWYAENNKWHMAPQGRDEFEGKVVEKGDGFLVVEFPVWKQGDGRYRFRIWGADETVDVEKPNHWLWVKEDDQFVFPDSMGQKSYEGLLNINEGTHKPVGKEYKPDQVKGEDVKAFYNKKK